MHRDLASIPMTFVTPAIVTIVAPKNHNRLHFLSFRRPATLESERSGHAARWQACSGKNSHPLSTGCCPAQLACRLSFTHCCDIPDTADERAVRKHNIPWPSAANKGLSP
jgi:hypothetical protein